MERVSILSVNILKICKQQLGEKYIHYGGWYMASMVHVQSPL